MNSTERTKKIYKAIFAIFVIGNFAIIIPMIGRLIAELVSYPYSASVVYLTDTYWSRYSYVLSLVLFALSPFVLKSRDQIFKQGFIFGRFHKNIPILITALTTIGITGSTFTLANALVQIIDPTPIFSILIIGGFSAMIYYGTPKVLNIGSKDLASKILGLLFALTLLVTSIFFASGTNSWNILTLTYMLFFGVFCIVMGPIYLIENFRLVKKPTERPLNDRNAKP
jgi:hypothetical protein